MRSDTPLHSDAGPTVARITLDDFRSYRHATLPLAPLTVLVGANASGKSNAIEAIRLLHELANGTRLDTLFTRMSEASIELRGTAPRLAREGTERFDITAALDHSASGVAFDQLSLGFAVSSDALTIADEALITEHGSPTTYEVYRVVQAPKLDPRWLHVRHAKAKGALIPCLPQQPVFLQLQSPAAFDEAARAAVLPATHRAREALRRIVFLDPVPQKMRTYAFTHERVLKADGSNVSGVLNHLWANPKNHPRILEFVRSLPEQDIEQIEFVNGSRDDVILALRESFGGGGARYDASLLSDGTLRVLAIAACLYSAPRGSLVVIEEIDNGVHPSRARKLLENIRTASLERGLRVLLTTHNPALLDAMPDVALPEVVFCYRDPEDGSSRLTRLADLPRFEEAMARGPLGRLLTQSVLDRYVKETRDPEAQINTRLQQFDALQGA